MPRVVRAPLAEADLDGIWAYLAADSVRAADNLIDRPIDDAIELVRVIHASRDIDAFF